MNRGRGAYGILRGTMRNLLLLVVSAVACTTGCAAHRSAQMPAMEALRFEASAPPAVLTENHFTKDQSGALGERELREILEAPIFLEEKGRLGVVPVASRYELDGEVPVESTPAEVSDTLEQSGLFDLTTEVSTDWPVDRGVTGLRELAGRYRTEYLLLYRQRFNQETWTNAWGVLYPTIIGIFAAPAQRIEEAGVLEATLFDVKTGTILFTVHERVRGDTFTTLPLVERRALELKKKLIAEAAPKLALQVVAKCRRLAASRPTAETGTQVTVKSDG